MILAESLTDATNDIRILVEEAGRRGLELNKGKSNILLFNMKE